MVRSNPHLRTILAFNKLGKEEILVDIVKHTSYMVHKLTLRFVMYWSRLV